MSTRTHTHCKLQVPCKTLNKLCIEFNQNHVRSNVALATPKNGNEAAPKKKKGNWEYLKKHTLSPKA